MMRAPHHTYEEHVSEVRLRIEARSLRELFEEAGRALAELSAEADAEATLGVEERIELSARDTEALLVAWLNELIFCSETRKLVYDALRVEHVDDRSLVATVRGRAPSAARTAVKAATMYDVRIEESPEGFAATIVLDV
jgi:SHS2 domain-containing protein